MKVKLAVSAAPCEEAAVAEVLSLILLEGCQPSFLFLFVTPQYDPENLTTMLRRRFPLAKVLGCSAEGVIAGREILSQGVVACALFGEDFQALTLAPPEGESDPYVLGQEIGKMVHPISSREGTVIILADPSLEVPLFLQGLYNVLGPRFLYLGGGTGQFRFTERGCVQGPVVVGVFGGVVFSSSVAHGWSPSRELLVVTKTRGREVVAIDGISPLAAYRERVGDFPQDELPRIGTLYPLGFPNVYGEFLIRDPAYFAPDGAMGFVGASVPQGAVGYLMKGEKEKLLAAAREVGEEVGAAVRNPLFALIFDCVSRFLFLGEDFKRELAVVQESVGDVPLCGFLSAGEIHPYGKAPLFRNKTIVVAVAGESKEEQCLSCPSEVPLEAELAVLHEISALSFPETPERFFQEIVERAVRLLGVQRMAFCWEEVRVFWGFSSEEEAEEAMRRPKEDQWVSTIGAGSGKAFLFLEAPFPLTRKERRLYTLFARKVEEILSFVQRFREREQRIQELEHLSITDDLTGLYNRRGFLILAEHALLQAKREGKETGILFIDLDNLKWINDQFGHGEGDRALQEFSRILRKVFRRSDILARIGGDEFVVFLKGVKDADLEKILSRLDALVEEWNASASRSYRLSFSAGWAFSLQGAQNVEELLSSADAKMYLEKRRKRGNDALTSP
ncbi:diguanylate cyclase [Candidatus Caldatribacterium sp.]|uniref:sensor domain-containing diguanylate cyclase n=1 Tax=Candidatus Caldatribacterium sp. TaxID=2282143 RepID=UPI00299BBDB2|nr:GGDEF domain-containing protein [Candidatus Caldatribacterium sp.]MDW8080552.1 GGDEF domain-containing protein [Candidatus Calescibacterium sp.]